MSHYPIFVSSTDSYADLWPLFFDLFKKYWPEYTGTIYLQTEELNYSHENLNIICTRVGKLGAFGKTFRAGLDKINSEHIMLIMIDYIFMGKVENEKINDYFQFYLKHDMDSLCLKYQRYPHQEHSENPEINRVLSPAPYMMFSYQIAFWKKNELYKMALPHENPWTSEWYGTKRAEKMQLRLGAIAHEKFNPIPYDPAGCLHKGKWLQNAICFLGNIDYSFDFGNRGYFKETKNSIKQRVKIKWMIIKDGLKGSYWRLK